MTIRVHGAPAWASLLQDVASVLGSAETPERRVDRVLDLTRRAVGADRVALYELVPILRREITVVPPTSPEETAALRESLADVSRLLTEIPTHREPQPSSERTSIALPLVSIGEILGMVRAEQRSGELEEEHVWVLSGVAALLASYLTVVRTQRELEATTHALRSVYQAGLVGIAFVDAAGAVIRLNEPALQMLSPPEGGGAAPSCDEALRLAEARFAGIIDIALDGIIVIDEAQRIVLFNKGAERIFGYACDEALGRPIEMLMPQRARAAHHVLVDKFARGPTHARAMGDGKSETVGLRKSGEEFPIEAAISSSESGGQHLLTVVLRDATERRRAEREQRVLVESAHTLGAELDLGKTLESIAALAARALGDCGIVYAVDAAGVPLHVRAAVADLSKAHLARAIELAPLGPECDFPGRSVVETRQPVLLSEIPGGYLDATCSSLEMRRALRELGPTSMIAVPLLTRDRCVGALVLVGTSATKRFDGYDLLLAQEVAGRAALALDNAALYRAAQAAVRARDDVLAIVAHDLRNPLNTIRLAASMLRDETLDAATAQRALDAVLRASGRAERLISDLLDVHRITSGSFVLSRSELSAGSLVADAITSHSALARAASIELRAEVPDRTSEVLADRDRVLQVFENLIGNALKFTPAGGRVTVSLGERPSEVVLQVADTGVGLSPDEVEHAFDRSWRGPRRERSGAGLGLAICRGIVEGHEGRIGVESTPGQGATFWFTLPKAHPEPGG